MQPHNKVTLSCLWHLVQQFFYFAECDCKHSDDQHIVEDDNTCLVDFMFTIVWNIEGGVTGTLAKVARGYVHADYGK